MSDALGRLATMADTAPPPRGAVPAPATTVPDGAMMQRCPKCGTEFPAQQPAPVGAIPERGEDVRNWFEANRPGAAMRPGSMR